MTERTRLTAYVSPEEYQALRIELIRRKLSVSEWVRQRIREVVNAKG